MNIYLPEPIFKIILSINTETYNEARVKNIKKMLTSVHEQLIEWYPGDDYTSEVGFYILAKIDGMPDLININM